MQQRLSGVTLAARDLAQTRALYVDRLGWKPLPGMPEDCLAFEVGPRLVVCFWDRAAMESQMGELDRCSDPLPVLLVYATATKGEVDSILKTVAAAGAPYVVEPAEREWGGYSGQFSDFDGYRWAVMWTTNPAGIVMNPYVVEHHEPTLDRR